jgi:alpha-tubulin suppressor-like RCC1 family protein
MPSVTSLDGLSKYTSNVIASDITNTSNKLIQDIQNTSNSISNKIADLYTKDLSFQQNVTINNDLTVGGNLTVDGTTTSINTDSYTTEILEIVSTNVNDNKPVLKVVETGTIGNIIEVYKNVDEVFKIDNSGDLFANNLNISGALTIEEASYTAMPTGKILFSIYGNADANMVTDIDTLNITKEVSDIIYPNVYILSDNLVAFNKTYWDTKNAFFVQNNTDSDDANFYYKTQSQLQLSSYFANGNYFNLKFYDKNTVNTILQLEPIYPPEQSDPVILSVSDQHSAVIFNNKVWTCGDIDYGERGNGISSLNTFFASDRIDGQTPSVVLTSANNPLTGITDVVCGIAVTIFLQGLTGVFACGRNSSGVLGRGTQTDGSYAEPVMIDESTHLTNVTKVSVGGSLTSIFAAFLLNDNTVMVTGDNSDNQITGTILRSLYARFALESSSPDIILTNVKDVSCGVSHSGFVFIDNTVKCVGNNIDGQLGIGSTSDETYPVSINGVNISNTGDIIQISCGYRCSGIVYSDGECYTWGRYTRGQLGVGSSSKGDIEVPTLVPLSVKTLCFSFSGEWNGFVGTDNKPYLAGEFYRKLVDGGYTGTGTVEYNIPTQIYEDVSYPFGDINNMTLIGDGISVGTSIFIYNNTQGWVYSTTTSIYQFFNTTYAAATNTFTLSDDFKPTITMFSNDYVPIETDDTDYVGANNVNETFFQNQITQIYGSYANFLTAKTGKNYEVFTATISKIATGYSHALILTDSIIYSWGTNQYGESGNGISSPTIDGTLFYIVQNSTGTSALSNVIDIACGNYHSLFIINSNTALGCGLNTSGQLGVGDNNNKTYPTPVVGTDGTGTLPSISKIYAGKNSSFFITTSAVYSCGENTNGQLGINLTVNVNKPSIISELQPSAIQDIKIGNNHTLALTTSGDVYAAGDNTFLQIGQVSTVTISYIFVKMQKLDTNGDSSTPLDAAVNKIYTDALLDKSIIKIPEIQYVILNNAGSLIVPDVQINNSLTANGNVTVAGKISVNDASDTGVDRGIRFWTSTNNIWAMYMSTSGEEKAPDGGTAPAGYLFSQHAIRVRIADGSGHGFIVENSSGLNNFSVRGSNGDGYFRGDVKIDNNLIVYGTQNIFNVGRGDVYIENNAQDSVDGAGITIRASVNPSNGGGSMFAVRSSGNACRLWVGQSITTVGANKFYAGFTGVNGEEGDTTKYNLNIDQSGNLTTTGTINGVTATQFSEIASGQTSYTITSMAVGTEHTVLLANSSTLITCGDNSKGQRDDDVIDDRAFFKNKTYLFKNILQVACGSYWTLYLNADGTVIGHGENNYGQLGDGTATSRNYPLYVLTSGTDQSQNRLSGVSQVACGQTFSAFLKSDTTVMGCGYNSGGQLGDGTSTNRYNPVYVLTSGTDQSVNRLSGVSQVACGSGFSVFLKSDTTVMACGNQGYAGIYGSFGDGTSSIRIHAVYVLESGSNQSVNRLSGISQVACGDLHTVFLKTDGQVMATGANEYGPLGDGTYGVNSSKNNPVYVLTSGTNQSANRLSGVSQVACGSHHTLFLKTDGTVMACGNNNAFRLGDGTSTNRYNPVYVLTSGTNQSANRLSGVSQIVGSCSNYHNIVIKTDNSLIGWGYNGAGQLGSGNKTNVSNATVIDFLDNLTT